MREANLVTKCIYVVQSDKGLPEPYRCIEERTILVSWKTRTPDTTMFIPNSTWTTGRNAAVNYIELNEIDCEYVIFLDDDLQFEGMTHNDGFQAFERFLGEQRPTIGVPRCWDYNTQSSDICSIPKEINRQGIQDTAFDTQPVDWFDACFNAYRWDAFQKLLPYDPRFDANSWYTSQFLLILKANLLYRNQIIQNNRIKIENKSLSEGIRNDYPRGVDIFGDAYRYFLNEHGIGSLKLSQIEQN